MIDGNSLHPEIHVRLCIAVCVLCYAVWTVTSDCCVGKVYADGVMHVQGESSCHVHDLGGTIHLTALSFSRRMFSGAFTLHVCNR